MRIAINIELLNGESFDDIVTMLQRTASSLSDSTYIRKELEQRFPWLPNEDACGSETIDAVAKWYVEVTEK